MPIDWKAPEVLQISGIVFTNVSHLAIGAYLFEAFQSVGFEWSVITRKRKFRWPMLLYFSTKWMLVVSFISMLIAMNNRSPVNCQALYIIGQLGGHWAIGGSSCLLMLRSLAIHKRRRLIMGPFAVIAAGHWGVLMWTVTTLNAVYVPELKTCVVNTVAYREIASIYFLTFAVDFVVLLVTMFGLNWTRGQSGLWNMIWDQGIIYFGTAVFANLIPGIVLLINLNDILNIICSIPSIALTATVACRCFVTLSEYASNGDDTSGIVSTRDNNTNPWTHRLAGPTAVPHGVVRKNTGGVSPITPGPTISGSGAQKDTTIQFTREVRRTGTGGSPHHIDTIAGIMGEDDVIHLDAYSPSKDSDGSSTVDERRKSFPPNFTTFSFEKKDGKGGAGGGRGRNDSIV